MGGIERAVLSFGPFEKVKLYKSLNSKGATKRGCLFPVRANAHQLLAKVCAFKETHECARCAVETLCDKLLVLYLALAHPLRHVTQEVALWLIAWNVPSEKRVLFQTKSSETRILYARSKPECDPKKAIDR